MTSRDRMALILLAVIALGAGAFYLLVVRGGEAPEPAPTDVASPSPAPSPDASPDEGEEPDEPPLETEEEEERPRPPRADFVAAGRDPFNPLVVAPDTGGAGTTPSDPAPNGDGTTPPGNGTTPPPGDGTTPPGNGTTPPGDGGPGDRREPQETQVIGGHRVTLIDIFVRDGEPVAQVRVDDETFVVAEGETFGDNFQLVAVQGGCANFLFGDQGFSLCEPGERK